MEKVVRGMRMPGEGHPAHKTTLMLTAWLLNAQRVALGIRADEDVDVSTVDEAEASRVYSVCFSRVAALVSDDDTGEEEMAGSEGEDAVDDTPELDDVEEEDEEPQAEEMETCALCPLAFPSWMTSLYPCHLCGREVCMACHLEMHPRVGGCCD
jgi:hypothetical protein